MSKSYLIIAEGTVQGVGFRYYTRQKAEALGICGTVENLTDGSVRIHAYGESPGIDKFLLWCHNGPSSASVDDLHYEVTAPGDKDIFAIIR